MENPDEVRMAANNMTMMPEMDLFEVRLCILRGIGRPQKKSSAVFDGKALGLYC